VPFENELLHANAIGHAPNVCGSHDIARYPFNGCNVLNVGNGSGTVVEHVDFDVLDACTRESTVVLLFFVRDRGRKEVFGARLFR
jgi:hypothetical protein